jgi:SAM-dependent methyltransferase
MHGGSWEQNQGRTQTRLFAECFHRHTKVPLGGSFSVLDVGCALGDALPVWHRHYPNAKLFGCDVAQTAIDRSRQLHGDLAHFYRASFEEIEGFWDVIYCSNVLEHFEQHVDIARELLCHCAILYVMTPFAELRDGLPLSPTPGSFHVATFYKNTFDVLGREGSAVITSRIVRCPVAWSPTWTGELRSLLKRLRTGVSATPRHQIIYTLKQETKTGQGFQGER